MQGNFETSIRVRASRFGQQKTFAALFIFLKNDTIPLATNM